MRYLIYILACILIAATPAAAQQLTCDQLTAIIHSAPGFQPFRGKGQASPDGAGRWDANFTLTGGRCIILATNNQGRIPDEMRCGWHPDNEKAFAATAHHVVADLLGNCPIMAGAAVHRDGDWVGALSKDRKIKIEFHSEFDPGVGAGTEEFYVYRLSDLVALAQNTPHPAPDKAVPVPAEFWVTFAPDHVLDAGQWADQDRAPYRCPSSLAALAVVKAVNRNKADPEGAKDQALAAQHCTIAKQGKYDLDVQYDEQAVITDPQSGEAFEALAAFNAIGPSGRQVGLIFNVSDF